MTAIRKDNHGTPFSEWLRKQKAIDSKLGFVATNIDFVWSNYKTGRWMLLEEKCRNAPIKDFQFEIYHKLHKACIAWDIYYFGFHVLKFSIERPDDGSVITLDHKIITQEELMTFLRFEAEPEVYEKNIF